MNFYHKAISLAGFVLLTVLPAQAQVRQTREEYINKYKKIAVAHMERYGIPASITMAQGILESDCGNSWLSQASNNHFGIKCKRNWTGDVVYYDDDEKGECFRSYPSVEASYQDHAEFLDSQPRYDSLFSYAPNDYKSWARGLKAAGYATAPDYAQRLIRIIEESKLYLLDREDGLTIYGHDVFSRRGIDACGFCLVGGEACAGDLRIGVHAGGNDGHVFSLQLREHGGSCLTALCRSHVGKTDASDQVSNGVNAGYRGFIALVYQDSAPLHFDAFLHVF